MSFGFCPYCQSEVIDRRRVMYSGNDDTCRKGHVYPSRLTLASPLPTGRELLQEAGQLLAAAEEAVTGLKTAGQDELVSRVTSAVPLLRELLNGPFVHRVRATRAQIDAHLAALARGAAA